MSWQTGQCPFYYTSHYTPTLTRGTIGLKAENATAPVVLGATGLGDDSTSVAVEIVDERLGYATANVVSANASAVVFATGPQPWGSSKELSVRAAGLGDAMVTQAGADMLPTIQVCADLLRLHRPGELLLACRMQTC